MVEVVLTDEALAWLKGLSGPDAVAAGKAIDRLEQFGLALEHPHSSSLIESKTYAFRELRVGGKSLRLVYAFDAARDAVVICGGDKAVGKGFYKRIIAMAEKIWEQYLREQGGKG